MKDPQKRTFFSLDFFCLFVCVARFSDENNYLSEMVKWRHFEKGIKKSLKCFIFCFIIFSLLLLFFFILTEMRLIFQMESLSDIIMTNFLLE